MLREIELDHFKCFRALTLPLQPLTLLTGVNASGKSTAIQALALLHQTAITGIVGLARISLDGTIVSLGTLGDVVDQLHGRSSFTIGIRGDDFAAHWTFGGDKADKRDIAVPLVEGFFEYAGTRHPLGGSNDGGLLSINAWKTPGGNTLVQVLEGMSYVCAERTGPREVYPLGDPDRHRTVGTQGELAPGLIHWFGEHQILESMRLPDGPPTLARQTELWLDHFFPGAGFEVQSVRGANFVTLGLRTRQDEDFHRPQNVGFGLSHLFPIIVAILHAPKGSVVLVENPEVHLHPQAQARIGQFLARAAHGGIQVIVETHSDHVLNGIRRAVRDAIASADEVVIHFFQPRTVSESAPQVITPSLDPHGNIDHWPEGFFDQFEKDLGYLAGL